MKKFFKDLFKDFPRDSKSLKREAKAMVIITLCLIMYAFAIIGFVVNEDIVSGGVNGVATLIYYATGGWVTVGVAAFVLNAILLLIGFKILGSGFGFKTVYAVVMLSVFLDMWSAILNGQTMIENNKFLSVVIGGILIGVSIGTSFNYGGSTGGTDIVALIVTKFRNISPGRVILTCDVFIISSAYFVFRFLKTDAQGLPATVGPIEAFQVVIYGLVLMGIVSYCIDLVVMGSRSSVQLLIHSQKYEEIAATISKDINRGVTLLHGKGYYSGNEIEVILIVARKQEMQPILRKVREIDPHAFTSITNASGVYGQGFEAIK